MGRTALAATLTLAIAACLGGGNGIPPEPRAGADNSKVVTDVVIVNSPFEWQRSPYYRFGDDSLQMPIFVAVAEDGTACLLSAERWATFHVNEREPCAGTWRQARPS